MLKHKYSIMLVDDESYARSLMEKHMRQMPDVEIVASLSNGLLAQKYLSDHIVDMVITDIRMPFVDGLELASFVKEYSENCPVVIISGYDDFGYAREAMRYGVRDYLLKPVTLLQIEKRVTAICNEIRIRREGYSKNGYNPNEDLEYKLFKTFMHGGATECWLSEISALLQCPGTLVRLQREEDNEEEKANLSLVYKRILSDALPQYTFLRLCYTKGQYDFLIIPKKTDDQGRLSAIPEYLNRLLEGPVSWRTLCSVSSANELESLSLQWHVDEAEDLIAAACKYMEAHLGDDLTRAEVAAYVYLSTSYFGRQFKRVKGLGYNEYLREIRLQQAKKLLCQNMPIREIVQAVGFQDEKYFRQIFLEKTGYVPSEYRRAFLKGVLPPDKI